MPNVDVIDGDPLGQLWLQLQETEAGNAGRLSL